ncbi:hypothetical protein KM043_011589 [Ampulex compressa]|nr:hypothetical protein KM043_011589 [Ampulex compressa]
MPRRRADNIMADRDTFPGVVIRSAGMTRGCFPQTTPRSPRKGGGERGGLENRERGPTVCTYVRLVPEEAKAAWGFRPQPYVRGNGDPQWGNRPINEQPFISRILVVSRVWKTLNGFLMTWSGPATAGEGRRVADLESQGGEQQLIPPPSLPPRLMTMAITGGGRGYLQTMSKRCTSDFELPNSDIETMHGSFPRERRFSKT